MPLNLNVSSMIRRQKSDSCLRPSPTPKSSLETSKYDNSLLNVLFSNYELVATLADLDRESIISRPSSRQQMWNNSTVCNVTEQSSGDSRFLDLKMELLAFCREVFDAFHFPKDDQRTERPQSLKLSAYILRRDLRRCYSSILPLLEVGAALQDIIFWKNPSFTLLITVVFFYSILRGWTASLVLLLLLLQLTLNYLHTCRQIDLGLYFLPRRPVSLPQFDMSGAQVIFDVAKTVQRILNVAADISEKLNNLLNWTNSRVTFVFYCLIIYWLLLSLMFSTGTCLGMCAFTLGIRIFITSYLFDRFPKLCWRLDTYGYFYRNLPVGIIHEKSLDGDIKLRSMSSISRSRTSPKLTLQPPSVPTQLGLDIVSPSSSASRPSFAGSQSLISSEDDDGIRLLMDDVVTSRQCVLFEKKQFFPKNIVPGTLCLTEKCVAFHPKNISAKSNVLALFQDILSVKKITSPRTIGFMAGSRKSIELCLMNRRKSVQFLGVSDRDEFVETLKMLCMRQKAATHFIIDKDNFDPAFTVLLKYCIFGKLQEDTLLEEQEQSYLLVLDFEATCSNSRTEIPQMFPVLALNTTTWTVDHRFHRYVKQTLKPLLTNFCTELTGITQVSSDSTKLIFVEKMVSRQQTIDQFLECFDNWLSETGLLVSSFCFVICGYWDLKTMLPWDTTAKNIKIPS